MTKENKANELEKRELTLDNFESVSGGVYGDGKCWFSHDGQLFDCTTTPDGDEYEAYRCKDCGHEWFEKNEVEIRPSDFYTTLSKYPRDPHLIIVGCNS